MAKVNVLNMAGETLSSMKLNDEVWAQEWNEQIIHDVVKAQTLAMRHGSSQTLNRAAVSGGGRKPYRQKGTGHARQGTIRAPQYVGGGHVFELHPRDYRIDLNKKVKRQALRIALSDKLKNNSLIVLDALSIEEVKTKSIVSLLSAIKANGKTIVVVPEIDEKLELSVRNIPTAAICLENHVSVYDILVSNTLVVTKAVVKYFEEALLDE